VMPTITAITKAMKSCGSSRSRNRGEPTPTSFWGGMRRLP
jgi:hypothetical protein